MISVRKFEERDIPLKIRWINDPFNNQYLHYELPLRQDKTEIWFQRIKNRTDRYDAIIEVDGVPVGLIGLLKMIGQRAELYIVIGEPDFSNRSVATESCLILLEKAFLEFGLKKVFLYTECDNTKAIRLFEKLSFRKLFRFPNSDINRGKLVDQYYYELSRDTFFEKKFGEYITPIFSLGALYGNHLYIKRDDLFDFSFGGNKAKKGILFEKDFLEKRADALVTYGSSSSNHCRVIANLAAKHHLPCIIISASEADEKTENTKVVQYLGSQIIYCPVERVKETIDQTLCSLEENGKKPYFIPGGGHGNLGTRAYVEVFEEIYHYEKKHQLYMDYIFHASGTGTTQAGLIVGNLFHHSQKEIVGISIARKNPHGRNVVEKSVADYLAWHHLKGYMESSVNFSDEYIVDGYGTYNKEIEDVQRNLLENFGLATDTTYTAKAFWGMKEYLKKMKITDKNILFIHTGGTPLFFNNLEKQKER